jgi:alginate O-acetyltransferase complex protein AlgI
MSFFSLPFTVFLILSLLAYYQAPEPWRPRILLGLSLAFYISWGFGGAVLLFAVAVLVFFAAIFIEKCEAEQAKSRLTALTVTLLLLLLAALKCASLLTSVFRAGAITALVAPLGLSYYVFRTVGYILDVYWGKISAQRNFVSLALYVSFFPQIVSGPIQRADDFFGQLDILETDSEAFVGGLRRILLGLFKKIVIADQLADLVAAVHTNPSGFSSVELLLGAYCYSVQLYMDLSGITDIAIGIGLLFGIKGPENFDRPFLAGNIQQFWRRWHMSLTTWLTDYLFLPLRMSLRHLKTAGLLLAIFITMVAIGIWHGPTWTYLEFGALNGVFMIVSVLSLKQRDAFFKRHAGLLPARRLVGPLLTFHLVVLAQVFFRADSSSSAFAYLSGLFPAFRHNGISPLRLSHYWLQFGLSSPRLALILIAVVAMDTVGCHQSERLLLGAPVWIRWGVYYAAIALAFFYYKTAVTFIYAQF